MRHLPMLIVVASGISLPAIAPAQDPSEHASHHVTRATAPVARADGEVRDVDKKAGKITLKHGRIESLGMPPMTMVFRVKDPAMLDQVKVGDKVKFAAEQSGGQMTVTQIERQL